MEFHVLGPLHAIDDGRPVTVTAPRQRARLAASMVHANEGVSADRLVDLVWGDDQREIGAIRYRASNLREALDGGQSVAGEGVARTESPSTYIVSAHASELDSLARVAHPALD